MLGNFASEDYIHFTRAAVDLVRQQGGLLDGSISRELVLNLKDDALKQR
jgi:uncharacterized Fe-S center protein